MRMRPRHAVLALVLLAALAACAEQATDDGRVVGEATDDGVVIEQATNDAVPVEQVTGDAVLVDEAWVRAAPPGAPALAGYALLRNPGREQATVTACDTDGFAATEIHRTSHEDGIARMRRVDELRVPAGGSVALEPGGTHLMLLRPERQPAVGDVVQVCLTFDGTPTRHAFPVRRSTEPADAHEHH